MGMLAIFRAMPVIATSAILFARDGMPFALKHRKRTAQGFNFLGVADLLALRVIEHFQNVLQLAQRFTQGFDDILDMRHGLGDGRPIFLLV